jgi:hypothetical protein
MLSIIPRAAENSPIRVALFVRLIDFPVLFTILCQVASPRPSVVWQITGGFAATLPIFIGDTVIRGERSADEQRNDLSSCQTGIINIHMTTNVLFRGIPFARRIVKVHSQVPQWRMLVHTSPNNALTRFREDQELTELHRV